MKTTVFVIENDVRDNFCVRDGILRCPYYNPKIEIKPAFFINVLDPMLSCCVVVDGAIEL